MIENADDYIPAFIDAGANWISVHQEACVHLDRVVQHIHSRGALAGVVINPATPVGTLADILDAVDYVLVMSVNRALADKHSFPARSARFAILRNCVRNAIFITALRWMAASVLIPLQRWCRRARKFWLPATPSLAVVTPATMFNSFCRPPVRPHCRKPNRSYSS